MPFNYVPLQRRLLARGAASVTIEQLWPMDWAVAGLWGMAHVMRRTKASILRAYDAANGQPMIVVSRSGGGIATRLAMSRAPVEGQRGGIAAEAVGCLVTLGTPHGLGRLANRYRHASHVAVEFLDRESPGAFFAPRTAYLSVGSRLQAGRFHGPVWAAGRGSLCDGRR